MRRVRVPRPLRRTCATCQYDLLHKRDSKTTSLRTAAARCRTPTPPPDPTTTTTCTPRRLHRTCTTSTAASLVQVVQHLKVDQPRLQTQPRLRCPSRRLSPAVARRVPLHRRASNSSVAIQLRRSRSTVRPATRRSCGDKSPQVRTTWGDQTRHARLRVLPLSGNVSDHGTRQCARMGRGIFRPK